MGNLMPLLLVLPFEMVGVFLMLRTHTVTVAGVVTCVLGLCAGWVSVNLFGLYGNKRLRADLARKVLPKENKNASDGVFVGFATPAYMGALDAHEDLGFLFIEPEQLHFHGEDHHVTISRSDVKLIRKRANIHSFLGLGGWVSVEAVVKGKPVRLLVEPRAADTLLGNVKHARDLRRNLEEWLKQTA